MGITISKNDNTIDISTNTESLIIANNVSGETITVDREKTDIVTVAHPGPSLNYQNLSVTNVSASGTVTAANIELQPDGAIRPTANNNTITFRAHDHASGDWMHIGSDAFRVYMNGKDVFDVDSTGTSAGSITLNATNDDYNVFIKYDDASSAYTTDAANHFTRMSGPVVISRSGSALQRPLGSGWGAVTDGNSALQLSGSLYADGDITASGVYFGNVVLPYNSGILAQDSSGNKSDAVVTNLMDAGMVFGNSNCVNTKLHGEKTEIEASIYILLDSNDIRAEGSITASGDISASGDIFAKRSTYSTAATYKGSVNIEGDGNCMTFTGGTDQVVQGLMAHFNVGGLKINYDGQGYMTGSVSGSNVEATTLKVDGSQVDFTNLPTSDPGVAGRLWNDSNTVKISAG